MFQKTRDFRKEFKEAKKEVLYRDGFDCQFRGIFGGTHFYALDVHHIKGRYGEDSNDKKELITGCRRCHDEIEKMPSRESILLCHSILSKKYGYKYE